MARVDDGIEPDQVPGAPHPREQHAFVGHGDAVAAFGEALRGGRLHHAWLIGGPEGVGKATLAYRVARALLDGRADGGLEVSRESATARQVAVQAHPGLAVLRRQRPAPDKPVASVIRVDEVREAMQRLRGTSASAGYRVAIVDAADDLNPQAANALLKMLEEPPAACVFLIVAQRPQQVMPTIRSRCRRLRLGPLAADEVRTMVQGLEGPFAGADPALIEEAVALGGGSVRRTLAMLDPSAVAVVRQAEALLAALPAQDLARILSFAESLSKKGAEAAFDLFSDTVLSWTSRLLAERAQLPAARVLPLVEAAEVFAETARAADTYNLDRRPLVVSVFGNLAGALRRT